MKIQFVKEIEVASGTIYYFTKIDEKFVSGSLSLNKDVAEKYYNNIIEAGGVTEQKILNECII
jgi:hypothetical protein